jgi:hypothetical protein
LRRRLPLPGKRATWASSCILSRVEGLCAGAAPVSPPMIFFLHPAEQPVGMQSVEGSKPSDNQQGVESNRTIAAALVDQEHQI